MTYTSLSIEVEAVQWWKHGDHVAVDRIPAPIAQDCGAALEQAAMCGLLKDDNGTTVVQPGDFVVAEPDGRLMALTQSQFLVRYAPACSLTIDVSATATDVEDA